MATLIAPNILHRLLPQPKRALPVLEVEEPKPVTPVSTKRAPPPYGQRQGFIPRNIGKPLDEQAHFFTQLF